MVNLFQQPPRRQVAYSAKDIEVLEGLEPVRRRPAMYVGGTDERALHHLFAEVLDNAMDEVLAGAANRIEVEFREDGGVTVTDNGRGIPVEAHPKVKDKSALEVILTTLHAGGKFTERVYRTAGGLHGVGLSVVNALSEKLDVEVVRDRQLWSQTYARGEPRGKLACRGPMQNRRGTSITFHPDPDVFGAEARFRPARLYRMARSKAYLFRGVDIRWSCAEALLKAGDETPARATLHFPGGLGDFLAELLEGRTTATPTAFVGKAPLSDGEGRVEWAVAWPLDGDPFQSSYCNTISTPQGGTHETGFKNALARGLKGYGELVGNRRAARLAADDVVGGACFLLSVFLKEPQFQGQTKERMASIEATRLVEAAVKDHFDHWLSADPKGTGALVELALARAEDRERRRRDKEVARKAAARRLRLPGKLADCTRRGAQGTEVFLVEGDSAGGSAKQARNRETQAVLPLKGKILNVASATADKRHANQELSDLVMALGCGTGDRYAEEDLRYERVIIMTDADVDGAHIASLLITFFYHEMRKLIREGHLYLAVPPLYRISQGGGTAYARDDAHKSELLATRFNDRAKLEISRFKGLGEMTPAQLRETSMDPATRTLLRVDIPEGEETATAERIERLMGRRPELRLAFIQDNAKFVADLDV